MARPSSLPGFFNVEFRPLSNSTLKTPLRRARRFHRSGLSRPLPPHANCAQCCATFFRWRFLRTLQVAVGHVLADYVLGSLNVEFCPLKFPLALGFRVINTFGMTTLAIPSMASPPPESFLLRLVRGQADDFFRLCETRSEPLETLRSIGRTLQLATRSPDFPDPALSEAIASKCRAINLELLAKEMSDEDCESILAEAGLA